MTSPKRFYNYGNAIALKEPPHNEMPTLGFKPNAVYSVEFDPDQFGIFLMKTVDLTLPPKIYGKADQEFIRKILKTFQVTNKSLGVLLSGTKGTGKTVTAKQLALESGLPIIKITTGFENGLLSAVVKFLLEIPEPYVLFIDEFEKLFPEEQQAKFLPFLDGFGTNPVLTILTINEKKISEFLINRLQRVRYHKEYSGLDKDTVLEIFDDLLNEKYHYLREQIMNTLLVNRVGTMDIVVSLIQEINIHGEDALRDIGLLNVSTEYLPHYTRYKCLIYSKSRKMFLEEFPNIESVIAEIQGVLINNMLKKGYGTSDVFSIDIELSGAPFCITMYLKIDKVTLHDNDSTGSVLKLDIKPSSMTFGLTPGLRKVGDFDREEFEYYLGVDDPDKFPVELRMWLAYLARSENELATPEEIDEVLKNRHFKILYDVVNDLFNNLCADLENVEVTLDISNPGNSRLVY